MMMAMMPIVVEGDMPKDDNIGIIFLYFKIQQQYSVVPMCIIPVRRDWGWGLMGRPGRPGRAWVGAWVVALMVHGLCIGDYNPSPHHIITTSPHHAPMNMHHPCNEGLF